MKRILITIIYIGFPLWVNAQEINLTILGRDSTETLIIEQVSYQKNHPDLLSLTKEADRLLSRLQKEGFINALYLSPQKQKESDYQIEFRLGEKIEILKIVYPKNLGAADFLRKSVLELTEDYFSIPFEQAQIFLEQLNNSVASGGKPFSSLRLSKIQKKQRDTLRAILIFEDTGVRKLDSIAIKGYEKFPASYLKHYARIKPGQVFDKNRLYKKAELLRTMEFARVTRDPEVLFTDDKTVLYLYLEKHNNNRFEGFLGFATEEESGKFKLDGDMSLQLVNNLNYGEAFYLHYKNNGADRQDFKTSLRLPYLFSSPFGLNLGLQLLRQDSTYTTNTLSAAVSYQVNPKTSVRLGYKSTASNRLTDSILVTSGLIEAYDANYLTLGADYTLPSSDNPLFPVRGTVVFELNHGNRKIRHQKTSQQRVILGASYLFDLDRRNSFYTALRGEGLFSSDYLENELARYGGVHSIRGFEEDQLRASLFGGIQTEYRYLLSAELYAHTIIDYAYLEDGATGTKTNLYSLGFGLGMQTGAGILKVAIANGKSDGESFSFDHTRIHLSLTAIF